MVDALSRSLLNTGYLAPENPLMCDIDDPAYIGCGHEQLSLNKNNAKRNQVVKSVSG